MTDRSTGGKRPIRRPPVKRPAPAPEPVDRGQVTVTSPAGTRATVPAELADRMRRQGWT